MTVGGAIRTSGSDAVGVLAQSIGGGAVVANDQALSNNIPTGSGSAVTVTVNDTITTSGAARTVSSPSPSAAAVAL